MNLVTDPRAVAISDGETDMSSSGSYSESSRTSRSSMDDLLERALLHGFDKVNRDSGASQARYTVRAPASPGPSYALDQVNIFQRSPRSGFLGSSQAGLRQRMDVQVDDGAVSGDDDEVEARAFMRNVADQNRQIASMERFRRTLEEMHAREYGSADESGLAGGGGPAAKKVRRKPDETARARLVAYNASMKAKQQEKYVDRVAREEEARLTRRPRRVSPAATRTGERLYLQGRSKSRVVEDLRTEQLKKLAESDDKECTFEPTITSYARRLASEGGYVDPQERLERDADRKEALQRRRLTKEAEELAQCPFQPTLAPHTSEIVAAQRRHSRGRSARGDSSSHEPFEAAERLYRDGGERLLRQQIRQRLAERRADAEKVGQRMVLSPAHAKQVTNRLEAWQRAKTRNLEFLRHEADNAPSRCRPSTATSSRPLSRSASAALVDRLAAPKRPSSVSSARSRATAGARPLVRSQSQSDSLKRSASARAAAAPGTLAGVPSSPPSRPLSRSSSQPSGGASSLRDASLFRGRWSPQALTPAQEALQQQFRLIRFGALFYKYASTPSAETLCCRDVRRQVRLYYPEDAGVAEALRLSVSGELVPVSKGQFVSALEAYELAHGPQPWGRTEKDKLLFPTAAAAASEKTSTKTPRASRGTGPGYGAGSRPSSVPLSRQTSRASVSRSSALPTTKRPMTRSATARSVGATSRSSSMRESTTTRSTTVRQPTRGELDQCTFRPKLSARTRQLSEIDRQRRVDYATERELRRRELQLLRTVNASSSTSQTPSAAANTPRSAAAAEPPRRETGRTEPDRGRSPSVELSSLSGSSPSSLERSAAAVAAAAARRAQKPAPAPPRARATDAARKELEALLCGYNKNESEQVPAATNPSSKTQTTSSPPLPPAPPQMRTQESKGFALQPSCAVLSGPASHGTKALPSRPTQAAADDTPSEGGSPNHCGVDKLYNVLYRGAWF